MYQGSGKPRQIPLNIRHKPAAIDSVWRTEDAEAGPNHGPVSPPLADYAHQEGEDMPVITMPFKESNSATILSATLRELCRYLSCFPDGQLSEPECAALAAAAIGGHAEAEFMVGSLFDAAGDLARAMQWYLRSASRDYLPAILQVFALR